MGASQGREQMPLLPEPVPRAGRPSCPSTKRPSLPSSRRDVPTSPLSGTLLTGVSLKAASQKSSLALPHNEKSPTVDSDVSTTDATGRSQDLESDAGMEENWSPDTVPRAVCPEARVLILDWDDTLLPTGFLRDALKIYSNYRAVGVTQIRRPSMMRKGGKSTSSGRAPSGSSHASTGFPCMPALEAHANLVRQVLTTARSLAHVAIVTLAERPWVFDSAEHYLPGLNLPRLLRDLDIPVYYAVEYRQPSRNPSLESPPSVSKRLAMEDFLSTIQLPKGARYNLLSIGDSMAEREAARHAGGALAKQASRLMTPLPLCKTVKLQADPSLKMLSWELRGLLFHLKKAVELDSDLDLIFEQQDSIEDIEEKLVEAMR